MAIKTQSVPTTFTRQPETPTRDVTRSTLLAGKRENRKRENTPRAKVEKEEKRRSFGVGRRDFGSRRGRMPAAGVRL
jgi:hypothetical protein